MKARKIPAYCAALLLVVFLSACGSDEDIQTLADEVNRASYNIGYDSDFPGFAGRSGNWMHTIGPFAVPARTAITTCGTLRYPRMTSLT